MSLLTDLDGGSLLEEPLEQNQSIFQFPDARGIPEVEQQMRSQIHDHIGLYLKDPSIFEPDRFRQEFAYVLPEGFILDPEKVDHVRVRYYPEREEVSFFIVPKKGIDIAPFRFRITKTLSEHDLIPPELLLYEEPAKMAA
jgi:hypothetical protein